MKETFETASARIDTLADRIWPMSDRVTSISLGAYEGSPLLGVTFKKNGRQISLMSAGETDCTVMDERGRMKSMPADKAVANVVDAFVATFPDYAQEQARDFLEGRTDGFNLHGKQYRFQPRR